MYQSFPADQQLLNVTQKSQNRQIVCFILSIFLLAIGLAVYISADEYDQWFDPANYELTRIIGGGLIIIGLIDFIFAPILIWLCSRQVANLEASTLYLNDTHISGTSFRSLLDSSGGQKFSLAYEEILDGTLSSNEEVTLTIQSTRGSYGILKNAHPEIAASTIMKAVHSKQRAAMAAESAKRQEYTSTNPAQPSDANCVFCTQCGTKLPANSAFCYKCGTRTVSPYDADASHSPQEMPVDDSEVTTDRYVIDGLTVDVSLRYYPCENLYVMEAPDFDETPMYSPHGALLIMGSQDACPHALHSSGELLSQTCEECGECSYYRKSEQCEFIGTCNNPLLNCQLHPENKKWPKPQKPAEDKSKTATQPSRQSPPTARPNGYANWAPASETNIRPDSVQSSDTYSMKWYHFLIYFALWAGAILNSISGFVYLSGYLYGEYADIVYDMFPSLYLLDQIAGVCFIALGVFALYVRRALRKFKAAAPSLLTALYVTNIICSVLYPILIAWILDIEFAKLLEGNANMPSTLLPSIITSFILTIANYIYFKKREDLFIN